MDAKKDAGESENDLMPDIYAEKPIPKAIDIEIVGELSVDDDESFGFDPYDTAKLHNKKAPK